MRTIRIDISDLDYQQFGLKTDRLLELAETCSADYLVTGNTRDFTMTHYKETKIVSTKEFFEVLNQ